MQNFFLNFQMLTPTITTAFTSMPIRMVIRILDYVKNASTYEDGDVIYKKNSFEIKHDRPVTISFEGISSVPSAFVNAAFIRLIEEFPFEKIRTYLRFSDSTKHINELIKKSLRFCCKELKNLANCAPPTATGAPAPRLARAFGGADFVIKTRLHCLNQKRSTNQTSWLCRCHHQNGFFRHPMHK